MTRDEAVARIQQDLGFRSDKTTEIISRLLEAQLQMEKARTLPDFLILEDRTLSLVAATNSVALPTNFLRRSDKLLRYTPTGTTIPSSIPWREYDEAFDVYTSSSSLDTPAGPKVASLRQSTIRFFPDADVDYTITWDYYKKDDLLDTNIENLWLANAPYVIIGYAGRRIASALRNKDALSLFDGMYKEALVDLYKEILVQKTEDPLVLGANN